MIWLEMGICILCVIILCMFAFNLGLKSGVETVTQLYVKGGIPEKTLLSAVQKARELISKE